MLEGLVTGEGAGRAKGFSSAPGVARRRRGSTYGAALTFAILACGCTGGDGPPNIVMVLVDALRADRLDAYGARRTTAPFVSELAARGVVFERAYANATWTRAALPTILTSYSPLRHGKVLGAAGNEDAHGFVERLSDGVVTLPEVLREAGYDTGAVVTWHGGAGFYSEEFGFRQGFDYVNDPGTVAGDTRHLVELRDIDERIVDHALEWVRGRKGRQRPFFLWVHLFGAHGPYEPPAGYESLFAPRDMIAAMRSRYGNSYGVPYDVAAQKGAELDYVRSQYEANIRFIDDLLRILIPGIERQTERPTIFVVYADHGEAFFEQPGQYKHGDGNFPYDPVTRIPLIVYAPGMFEPRRVAAVVSQLDLFPTLAEVAGAATPSGIEGASLVPLMRDRNGLGERVVPLQSGVLFLSAAGVAEEKKYLYLNPHNRLGSPRPFQAFESLGEAVYDLRADPEERFNVLFYHADFARRMRLWTERFQLSRMFGWHLVYRGRGGGELLRGRVRADVPLYRMNIRYVGTEAIDEEEAFAESLLRTAAEAGTVKTTLASGSRPHVVCPRPRRSDLRYRLRLPIEWVGRTVVFGARVEPLASDSMVSVRVIGAGEEVLREARVAGLEPGSSTLVWNRLLVEETDREIVYEVACTGPRGSVRVTRPFLALERLWIGETQGNGEGLSFEGALHAGRLAINFATLGIPSRLALELSLNGRAVAADRLLAFDGEAFSPVPRLDLDADGIARSRVPVDAYPVDEMRVPGHFYLYRTDPGEGETAALSGPVRQMLRALGYLDGR
jgi:arylsulfatase A-like enzyme